MNAINRRLFLAAGSAALTYCTTIPPAGAQSVSPAEARQIAEDAYVYGYSLITTEVTRVQMSNVPKVEGFTSPIGQFVNVPRYPPADYRGVSAPNADTLYSVAWLDLAEPQVFSHPDMGDRFYLFEITDLWMSDFESSPGKRTTGGKAANYLFTAPGWKGEVPAGMKHFPMATRYMVILGRTYADGSEADYKAVNALQAQYKITPLSAWGKPYTFVAPPVNPNPGFQHDRQAADGHSRHGNGRLLQSHGQAHGCCSPSGRVRCADARKHGEDRHRSRQAVRDEQARSSRTGSAEGHPSGRSEKDRSQQGESRCGGRRVVDHEGSRYLRPFRLHEARGGSGFRLARQPGA